MGGTITVSCAFPHIMKPHNSPFVGQAMTYTGRQIYRSWFQAVEQSEKASVRPTVPRRVAAAALFI